MAHFRESRGKWVCACLCLVLVAADADKVKVHGRLPPGARAEFQAAGSPEKITVEPKGRSEYSIELPPDRYDIYLITASGRRAQGAAWITGAEVELNAAPLNPRPTSTVEYDLVAEWRVKAETGKGLGPARVTLEGIPARGAPQRLTVWVPAGEEEKEVQGALETAPDGRFVFRVRESRIRPDRVVALVVKVEMEGYAPATQRLTPTLEFSESGHLFARYPEDGVEITLARRAPPLRPPT